MARFSDSPGRRIEAVVQDAAQGKETVKRYDICWTALDPTLGSEMARTRPAVIVSLDVLNAKLQTVTICPLTTALRPKWRTRLATRSGGRAADVAVDQIRAVAKSRIGKRIGSLTDAEATALRRLITEMYGE